MADTLCAFPDRDETIVTYLYDDMDERLRATFDAHLTICARCRTEVSELADLRADLAEWHAPAIPMRPLPVAISPVSATPVMAEVSVNDDQGSGRSWWRGVPAWAQVAAAMLFLGASAGLANLDVRYDQQGVSIRTGWMRGSAVQTRVEAPAAPWRADLTALEQQLRTEFREASAPAAAAAVQAIPAELSPRTMSDAEILRRVRALVEESDKRQQRELALRVADVMNNVTAQRNADLLKIDHSLGLIRNNTAAELMKQRGTINYLVSTTQR
jgi:hypothetical protein